MIRQYADLLKMSMVEYRRAEKRDPDYGKTKEFDLLDDLDKTINELDYQGGIYTANEINIPATEYWRNIIRAQITCIEIAGGFDLMQKVCYELDDLDGNAEYNFSALFDSTADGIGIWVK